MSKRGFLALLTFPDAGGGNLHSLGGRFHVILFIFLLCSKSGTISQLDENTQVEQAEGLLPQLSRDVTYHVPSSSSVPLRLRVVASRMHGTKEHGPNSDSSLPAGSFASLIHTDNGFIGDEPSC